MLVLAMVRLLRVLLSWSAITTATRRWGMQMVIARGQGTRTPMMPSRVWKWRY